MPMIWTPASLASWSGPIIASGSVIEIMIASGLSATTALTIAVCLSTANVGSPWVLNSTPSLSASDCAPQDTDE